MEKKVPDINEIAKICSTCGNCLFSCPVYNAELIEPNSPRGKINLIRSLMASKLTANKLNKRFIYQCLVCGSCRHICPNGVEFVDMMVKYRNRISAGRKIPLLKKVILGFYQSFVFRKFIGVVDILNRTPLRKILSLPRRLKAKQKNIFTAAKKGGYYDILLFPGCVLTYFYPALIEKIIVFLNTQGFSVVVPKNLHCCGFPYITQGWQDKFGSLQEKNKKIFSAFDFKYLVVPCGTGLMAFKNYYEWEEISKAALDNSQQAGQPNSPLEKDGPPRLGRGIEIYELTEFIYKFVKEAKVDLKIPLSGEGKLTYHDPCHDLKVLNVEEEPRYFMKQFGKNFVDDKSALCCGFGGIFSVGFPATAKKILKRKAEKIKEVGASTVVTSCPGCYYQLRENLSRDVKFFIELF